MIDTFLKLKGFGCFSEYEKEDDLPEFNQVNILYGPNGCGKSTLSNLLSCLASNCTNKTELLENYISNESEVEIKINGRTIRKNQILNSNQNLYVFNTNFISEHIFDGSNVALAKFSEESRLTTPRIEQLDEAIEILNRRINYTNSLESSLNDKLTEIYNSKNQEFQRNISGARLTNVKPKISENITTQEEEPLDLEKLYQKYKNKKDEENLKGQLNRIQIQCARINFEIPELEDFKLKLTANLNATPNEKIKKHIEELTIDIENRGHSGKLQNPLQWIRNGARFLFLNKERNELECPICHTNLDTRIDTLLEEYSSYFNEEAENLLKLLDKISHFLKSINSALILENIDLIEADIKEIIPDYKVENSYKEIDIQTSINYLENKIEERKRNISLGIEIDPDHLNIIYSSILKVNSLSDEIIDILKKKSSEVDGETLTAIISQIKVCIKRETIVDFNSVTNKITEGQRRTNSEFAARITTLKDSISSRLLIISQRRVQELSTLDAESKFVNEYLRYLGIEHFKIRRETETGNIQITYLANNQTKTGIKNSLSEGEKTSLAFSYFISKIRAELLENQEDGFQNTIFVIDDPISSLDENRLFQTANLIDSFFFYLSEHIPKQIFFFSHNQSFLKFLNNNLKTNANIRDSIEEFSISKERPRISKLPSPLKNFTNTYLYKVRVIENFKNSNQPSYDECKNYLPNYIRIVIETFLSFKLALVRDDDGYLPSGKHLIRKMVSEFNNIDEYAIQIDGNEMNKTQIIQRLNHLKRISDHESHGSISLTEEFKYISRDDLKSFAKYTLQVIEYLDDIHIKRIRGM